MSQIDETESFVMSLYREGSTNNENLQILLWQLKEIVEKLERTDDELGVEGDKFLFLNGFLTKLANLYRPTNTSEYPIEILKINGVIAKHIEDIEYNHQIEKLIHELKDKVMVRVVSHSLHSSPENSKLEKELSFVFNESESKILESLHKRNEDVHLFFTELRAITIKWLSDCRY
jgi:hypothetical protein